MTDLVQDRQKRKLEGLLQIKEGNVVDNAHVELIKTAYNFPKETIHVELDGCFVYPQRATHHAIHSVNPGQPYNKKITSDTKITGCIVYDMGNKEQSESDIRAEVYTVGLSTKSLDLTMVAPPGKVLRALVIVTALPSKDCVIL